jgi:hypothetical protein
VVSFGHGDGTNPLPLDPVKCVQGFQALLDGDRMATPLGRTLRNSRFKSRPGIQRSHAEDLVVTLSDRVEGHPHNKQFAEVCTSFYRAPRRASTAQAVFQRISRSDVNDQFST